LIYFPPFFCEIQYFDFVSCISRSENDTPYYLVEYYRAYKYGGELVPVEQIQVYGTRWCPDCLRVKQVFSRRNITFDWIDIEQDEGACAYVEKVNGGFKSVPTIVFPDGSVLVEPSNAVLERKLSEGKRIEREQL
jgi:mycoredoxin